MMNKMWPTTKLHPLLVAQLFSAIPVQVSADSDNAYVMVDENDRQCLKEEKMSDAYIQVDMFENELLIKLSNTASDKQKDG